MSVHPNPGFGAGDNNCCSSKSTKTMAERAASANYRMGMKKTCGCFKDVDGHGGGDPGTAIESTLGRAYEGRPKNLGKHGRYAKCVAKCPCQCFGANLGVILLMCMAVSQDAELTENSDAG